MVQASDIGELKVLSAGIESGVCRFSAPLSGVSRGRRAISTFSSSTIHPIALGWSRCRSLRIGCPHFTVGGGLNS